ncbi:MAG TPA: ABC transporter permease [Chitinophagaceae bacterium]|nr:ABC transporter permease [Chitinophagaceae bacterium]
MVKNYLKTAIRNLRKNKVFSFINIFGLAIGLCCFMLIALFVYSELSYDQYPAGAKNMYRVLLSVTGNGDVAVYPDVDWAVGPGIRDAFPEVKAFTRVSPATDFVKYNDRQFKESKLAFADSNFLQLFSIPLIEGSDKDALTQPNTVVVSEAFAKKYFANEDPVGKSLVIGLHNALYKVTGVFDKIPDNSHFHFDAIMSVATFHLSNLTWSNLGPYTYMLLNKNADVKKLESKIKQLVATHVVPEIQHDMGVSLAEAQKSVNTFVFSLQPLTGIHLYSHTKYEIEPNGDIQYVYTFSALAVFILLLACINFTNLSTARAVKRAKEVGIRKVLGSARLQLIRQFLIESIMLTVCAMLLAFLFAMLLLPYFDNLAGKEIHVGYLFQYKFIISLLALIVIVGILAGIYPAFFLSSFNAAKVLKGASVAGRKSALRSGLIVFQFFVSTALIIATLIVSKQLHFMQNKKLGYDPEQVLYIPDGRLLGNNQLAFKQQLLQDTRVADASISRSVPGDIFMDGTEIFPKNDNGNGQEIHTNIFHVDYDYLNTLGIKIKEGRYFSKDFPTDSANGVVINEAAVKQLGWNHTNPVGKSIVRSGQKQYQVIGVVDDFNYASAKQEVAPLMMMLGNNFGGFVIKIKTSDVTGFINDLKKHWNSFSPDGPLNYSFLDEKFAALYASEERTQQIFSSFAVIAIIIAALGLFGLSAFVIEQRAKEIGIRKVLGASVQQVLLLVSKEFLSLVAVAFIISVPVTWFAMHQWLQDYAYRVSIGISVFAVAGIAAVLIALGTISFQAIKAAMANPVRSLRTE